MFTNRNNNLTTIQRFCAKVLKQGPIPRHVAVIMDGNRRFARQKRIDLIDGHTAGFTKLMQVMAWCHELGIKELTAYAFSIENFKRPAEEVNGLFRLMKDKFQTLWEERDEIQKYGLRLRAIGRLLMFPDDIKEIISRLVKYTEKNNGCFLNIAIGYSSRDDIYQAVQLVLHGVELQLIEPADITEDVYQHCLYTYESPNPDVMIRTSGAVRLSDFLLWQCSYSMLMFTSSMWPDFNIWEMFYTVFCYQHLYSKLKVYRDGAGTTIQCGNNNTLIDDKGNLASNADVHFQERVNRVNKLYSYVEKQRQKILETMLLQPISDNK